MPYAPGIQDISGQLIAQGMSQAGAARARAIESIGESIAGGMRQYQQNQLFTNQALGKFGSGLQDPTFKQYVQQIVNDDPNAPQVPDALKKAFKNAQAGKVDIYDAALLGTAAEGYQQNKARQAQAEAAELQRKLLAQQVIKAGLENKMMEADAAFLANIDKFAAQQPESQVTRGAVPPEQAAAINRFATAIPRFGEQAVPAGVPAMLARAEAPQPFPAAAPAPEAALAGQRPYAGPTQQDLIDARNQLRAAGTPRPSESQVRLRAKELSDARAKQFVPSGVYQTEEQADAVARRLDESSPIPGYVRTAKYDPQAKGHVITQLPKAQTAEEKARESGLVEGAKATATAAANYLNNLSESAMQATDDMGRLQRIRQLYREGATTGFASNDWLMKVRAAGVEFGLIDSQSQATKEELIALLAQDALAKTRTWLKGQGSVANAERERIDRISTDAKKRPEANLELVRTTEGVYRKFIAGEEERMRLEADKRNTPVDVERAMKRWWLSNKLESFMEAPAAQAPSGQPITRRRVYGKDFN